MCPNSYLNNMVSIKYRIAYDNLLKVRIVISYRTSSEVEENLPNFWTQNKSAHYFSTLRYNTYLSINNLSVKEEGRLLIFNDETTRTRSSFSATRQQRPQPGREQIFIYTMILDNPYNTSQWRTSLTIFQNKEVTNFYVVHVFAITMLCIRDNIQLQAPLHHGGTGYTTWDGKLWIGP